MKPATQRLVLGVLLAAGLPMSSLLAAEGEAKTEVKALPTLLIKGEIVSVDTSDPAATLLKVKDRYGFETPIYLKPETKIAKGDAAVQASSLATGTAVEVEYNFDVNTAKRHAVSVKVSTPTSEASAPVAAAPAAAPVASPAAPAPVAPAATPAVPTAPAASAQQAPAAPSMPAAPATAAPAQATPATQESAPAAK